MIIQKRRSALAACSKVGSPIQSTYDISHVSCRGGWSYCVMWMRTYIFYMYHACNSQSLHVKARNVEKKEGAGQKTAFCVSGDEDENDWMDIACYDMLRAFWSNSDIQKRPSKYILYFLCDVVSESEQLLGFQKLLRIVKPEKKSRSRNGVGGKKANK